MSQDGNNEHQDPEVEARAVRRRYTAEYKKRILDEIDRATQSGEIGAILRREGLYSQAISKWRAQRERGSLDGLNPEKRGPKHDPNAKKLERLRRENESLRKKLKKAELIIEVQKKISRMLELDEKDQGENNSSR